jgi:hypothetical protein
MNDRIQLLDPPRRKGDSSQRRAIQPSIGLNHTIAEVSDDRCMNRLPRLH